MFNLNVLSVVPKEAPIRQAAVLMMVVVFVVGVVLVGAVPGVLVVYLMKNRNSPEVDFRRGFGVGQQV